MDHSERINSALAYIERHLGEQIDLDVLATQSALSRFHFDRVFRVLVGQPPMRYLHRRRLARSIEGLSGSSARVLDVALECGFNSHEAFSRAFRREFGVSPSLFRARTMSLDPQPRVIVGEIDTKLSGGRVVPDPRIVNLPELTIGAYRYHGRDDTMIGPLWDRFWERSVGHRAFRETSEYMGICFHDVKPDGASYFDYYAGAVLYGQIDLPKDMTSTSLSSSVYLSFAHKGGPDAIAHTYHKIYACWLPYTDRIPAADYDVLRVNERFLGAIDESILEILVPISA